MKSNTLIWFCLILCILFFAFYNFKLKISNDYFKNKIDTIITTKTDTLWRDTTIWKYKFKPVKEEIIRHDTIKTPQNDSIIIPITSKAYTDTICANNDSVIVQSYISGYKPNLDSLRVYMKKQEIVKTNTITITKTKTKCKKIGIGLQAGYGYGFRSKQIEPYIGVGISVNF